MDKAVTEEELVAASRFPRITPEQLDEQVQAVVYDYHGLAVKCTVTMKNGYSVHGESGCAVPGNYKREFGERLAFQDAKNKMWQLLGYELKTKVALAQEAGEAKELRDAPVYVGTKALWARPMTRGAYNLYRGWEIPANENPDDEGYIVEYPDGHISWSPKDTFEASYEIMDVNGEGSEGGLTWRDRVEIEYADLSEKLTKLWGFLGSSDFKQLPEFQRNLLRQQSDHMAGYLSILEARKG